jgi:hypothetical protein
LPVVTRGDQQGQRESQEKSDAAWHQVAVSLYAFATSNDAYHRASGLL